MIVTIEIPGWLPTPLNQIVTGHWARGHRLKKHDAAIIQSAVLAYGVPEATGKRAVRMTCIYPKGKRSIDPDGLWKSTLDALVHCGALKNDSRIWVELMQPEILRGKEAKTFITLEDVA